MAKGDKKITTDMRAEYMARVFDFVTSLLDDSHYSNVDIHVVQHSEREDKTITSFYAHVAVGSPDGTIAPANLEWFQNYCKQFDASVGVSDGRLEVWFKPIERLHDAKV